MQAKKRQFGNGECSHHSLYVKFKEVEIIPIKLPLYTCKQAKK